MKFFLQLIFLFLLSTSLCFGGNYYWVGGSGNWSDLNHWATSSGGNSKHSVVPSPNDNVFFDNNSFIASGDTINMNLGITTCRNLDFSGATKSHKVEGNTTALKIFGSFKLSSFTTLTYNGEIYFEALTTGHTIYTAGNTFPNKVYFNGIGGGYILTDAFTVLNSVIFNYGELNTNGKKFKCNVFYSQNNNSRILNITSSEIFTTLWLVNGTNLTVTAANSTIYINNSSGGGFEHIGTVIYNNVSFTNKSAINTLTTTNATFGKVRFAGDGGINGNNTYDSLILGFGKTYTFETSKTQTFILGLKAEGDCNNRIKLLSNGLTQAQFSKSSGTVVVDQAKLQNIAGIGGAGFIANNSIDLGNNTGWIINPPLPLTLYWVGGTGDWDNSNHWSMSSGGPGGACVPRKTDNVFFDNNSFSYPTQTVKINVDTAECKNMTWIVTAWQPIFDGKVGLNLNIYGSLAFCQSMDVIYECETRFLANTANKTILMAGNSFPNPVYFDRNNGGWILLDTFRTESVLLLKKGNLNTNGKTVYCKRFESISGVNRSLTLVNSHFYLTGFGTNSTWIVNDLNFTLSSGTSIIKFTGDTAGMNNSGTNNLVYHNVEFLNSGGMGLFLNTSVTFNRVSFFGNSKISGVSTISDLVLYKNTFCEISAAQTQYILDSLIAYGDCTGNIFIYSSAPGINTNLSKTSGVINVDQVILKDIAAVGGAVFTASNSYDLGNNTNWIFTNLLTSNRYWIDGTGNWDDTSHWSYTSGGQGGACVPTPGDNVFFDVNSFSATNQIISINVANAMCRDMTWTGSLYNPTFLGPYYSKLRIFGSLTFIQNMILTLTSETYFEAMSLGKTITSAGKVFFSNVHFCGLGGGWILLDDFDCSGGMMNFLTGNLNFNKKKVTAKNFYSYNANPRVFNISSSEINIVSSIGYAWILSSLNLTFLSDSSHIDLQGTYASFKTLGSGLLSYWNVIFSATSGKSTLSSFGISCNFNNVSFFHSGEILGTNIFDTLFFSPGTWNHLESSTTQTVTTLLAMGNCNKYISLLSTSPGIAANIVKNSGNLVVDFVKLQDNAASGGATFTALNSDDLGNNSGWNIGQVTSKNLYWVNGQGNWDNPYHWSFTSGGAGGDCVPTPIDDVFFDNNSFILANDTVFVNVNASCRNKTWTVTLFHPIFYTKDFTLSIYGSLIFCNSMKNAFSGVIYFLATTTGKSIISAGHNFLKSVNFVGQGGGWTLLDDFAVQSGHIEFTFGNLNTNGKKVSCLEFNSNNSNNRTLTLGASEIKVFKGGFSFSINTTNLTLYSGTSKIRFFAEIYAYFTGLTSGKKFHNIFFECPTGTSLLLNQTQSLSYNHVFFKNNGKIMGKNIFDSLSFSPGLFYQLDKDEIQTIVKHFRILGNNCFPITLQSTQLGYQATITKSSGDVNGDFIHMRDVKAIGGATFYAGINSADVSNNSGWIFNNSPGYIFGLGHDTLVCSFDPFILTTANFNGGSSFLWSTGSTSPTIAVSQTGLYSVTVTYDNNCQISDDIFVWYYNPPIIDLGNDTTICEGASITLNPGTGYTNYLWSNGNTNNKIDVKSAGLYNVIVQDTNGCRGNDSILIGIYPLPHVDLGKNTYLCLNDSITIYAPTGQDSYLWQDSSTLNYYIVKQPGSYFVLATNRCGVGSDTISFHSIDCSFFAPNVFTPNFDGYNDEFSVIAKHVSEFYMQIFNRWGTLVFKSDNIESSWDGKYKENECPSGVYFFTVDYNIQKASGTKETFSNQGTVTLMR